MVPFKDQLQKIKPLKLSFLYDSAAQLGFRGKLFFKTSLVQSKYSADHLTLRCKLEKLYGKGLQ